MERDIKFRGKTTVGNSWVYGFYQYDSDLNEHFIRKNGVVFVVFPETVGQYTILKDKNSNEIYEGDIINCIEKDEMFGNTVHKNCIVIFDKCSFFYCPNMNIKQPHQILYYANDAEIIGNINDNPKLLK